MSTNNLIKSDNSTDTSIRDENTAKLRFDFIGMMFALAIAQVGVELGDFYVKSLSIRDHLYVLTHLLLAIFIISSSWIGWQKSKSKGNNEAITDSFSLSYIVLLVDLFLVIFYFIIVKGVEKPTNTTQIASGDPEVFWSMVIFGIYFIWDIITKLIDIENHETLAWKLKWKTFLKRGYQAPLCFGIIFFLFQPMTEIKTSNSVVILDIALILTFALFRGLKSEHIFQMSNKKARNIRIFVSLIIPLLGVISIFVLNYFDYV
ncbi:hypothetical protein [Labilibaculum euxinus]|uniref:Uncharacterized protein n=1 Tax=Labilibaculum euxinus TaxID=2686357 RepID=A0A7M4D2D2_9BACT|nr:hypothetical protein [Labilibaculum euxinus]MUP36811.1 hypothetical protein [Labilibaculum euxinus]MVB06016.1 hypothetical protein [Labilibaculum euxinus]